MNQKSLELRNFDSRISRKLVERDHESSSPDLLLLASRDLPRRPQILNQYFTIYVFSKKKKKKRKQTNINVNFDVIILPFQNEIY